MLKLNPHQKREPIGGHQFTEKGVTFTGDTFNEVVEKLSDFRTINGLPLGSPEQDVLWFYALHWPFMVMEDRDSAQVTLPDEFFLWRKWIVETWAHPPHKFVAASDSVTRRDVCEKCPFNKPLLWKETKESSELTRRAFLLRRGTTAASFLGFCSLHNVDLSVFTCVETPENFSAKKKDAEKYPGCWLK